jgi:hypothetical protein
MGESPVTTTLRWHRSSYSQSGSECVELAHTLESVRDSTNPAAALTVPALARFVALIKSRW